jgi:raffinose/stachyose/melibiose transport system permease protein
MRLASSSNSVSGSSVCRDASRESNRFGLLSPITLVPIRVSLAILNAITALKLFDYPYLITGGGPANSSEFLGTYIYAQLFGVSRNYGYASALSILLLILALGVSIIMGLSARERTPGRTIKRGVRV